MIKYITLITISLTILNLSAQNKNIETSGDVLQLAIPGAAFISTIIWKEDNYSGTIELVKSACLSTLATYSLKYTINKPRPNGETHAFPSGHTSRAFTGAAFVQRKYGWYYGVPAYLLASYTGWTRIHSNNHDYWDILGGAAIGIASVYIFTKPLNNGKDQQLSFGKGKQGYTLYYSYNF
jgi:membrane-associated phospholipid phosphatase